MDRTAAVSLENARSGSSFQTSDTDKHPEKDGSTFTGFSVTKADMACLTASTCLLYSAKKHFDIQSCAVTAAMAVPVYLIPLAIKNCIAKVIEGKKIGFYQQCITKKCVELGGDNVSDFSQMLPVYQKQLINIDCRGLASAWLASDENEISRAVMQQAYNYQQLHKNKVFIFTIVDSFKDLHFTNKAEGNFEKFPNLEVLNIKESDVKKTGADNTFNRNSRHTVISISTGKKAEHIINPANMLDKVIQQMHYTDRMLINFIQNNQLPGHAIGFKVNDDKVTVFDPNFGVYVFSKEKSQDFFAYFFQEFYPHITEMYVVPLGKPSDEKTN